MSAPLLEKKVPLFVSKRFRAWDATIKERPYKTIVQMIMHEEVINLDQSVNVLGRANRTMRDGRVVAVTVPHIYFIDGSCEFVMSTTELVGCFYPPFDTDKVAHRVFYSPKRQKKESDYYECKSVDDIKAMWKKAQTDGSELHACIDVHENGGTPDISDANKQCMEQYLAFRHDKTKWPEHWKAYRTEMVIFDEYLLVAGTLDMLVWDDLNKKFIIIDWKRNASISKEAYQDHRMFGVCSELKDCKFDKQTLQLNVYKFLLEKHYGFEVSQMFVVQMHPSLPEPVVHEIPDKQAIVEAIMERRKQHLAVLFKDKKKKSRVSYIT